MVSPSSPPPSCRWGRVAGGVRLAVLAAVAAAVLAAPWRATPASADDAPANAPANVPPSVPAGVPAGVPPKGTEATGPSAGPLTQEQKVQRLLDYLEADYAKKVASPLWISRAMGAVSLARSPRPAATGKLFEILEKDKHEVVRLLAWQAILARAGELDSKNFNRFYQLTLPMADKDMFRGGLRAPLLHVLACAGPNPRVKKVWEKAFTESNAWQHEDIPVLDALGACVEAWRSPVMVEAMIKLLGDNAASLRAELVLRRAGSPVPTAASKLPPEVFDPMATKRSHPSWAELWSTTKREHEKWWAGEKSKWKEVAKPEGAVWKELKPAFVAAPFALDAIDPDDKLWYQDLELGRVDIAQFEAAFVVDTTGTMGDVLDWLKRDLGRMAAAFQMICKEPVRTGVTFYKDYGDAWVTKHLPLTSRLQTLEPDVAGMAAAGGGDIPEAILPALKDTLEKNKWTQRARGASKVVILLGDAPPHTKDMEAIVALAKKHAEGGLKIHAAKIKTEAGRNDLTTFDEIATAGGGQTVEVEFRRPVTHRIIDALGGDIPYWTIERPEMQMTTAPASDLEPPGEKVLTLVVSDAINPQFRNRVEPLARTLLAFCARPGKPEMRKPFPANTPPLNKGVFKPQG